MAQDLASAASKGVAITVIAQAAKILLQFGSVILLARLLEPRDFGVIALVLSFIGIADVLRDFGLSTAAIQAPTLSPAQRSNLFWINVLLGLAITIIVAAAAPIIANLYNMPVLVSPLLALSLLFLVNGATAQHVASLSRELQFKSLAFSTVLSQGLGIVAAVLLAWQGAGFWALVAQQLVSATTMLLLAVMLGRWLPVLPDRRVSIAPFLRFGAATVGTQGIAHAARNVDMLALGFVSNAQALGYYNRAGQLVSVPLDQINGPLTRVALPILSKVSAEPKRLQRYLEKSQIVACYFTATALFVLAGLAEPIVNVLLGPKWMPVAPLLAILAVGGVFRSINQVTYWAYMAQGLVGEQLRLFVRAQPLVSLLVVFGLPWGAPGVAVAYAIGQLLFWLTGLWHMQLVSPVKSAVLFRRSVQIILFLGAPAGLVAFGVSTRIQGPILQILGGGCAALIYIAAGCFLWAPFRDDAGTVFRFGLKSFGR